MKMIKEKKAIYTSGCIELSTDPYTWRNKMVRALSDYYNVIVPDILPCPYMKTDNEYSSWIKTNYILPDMAAVATSHNIFVLIDHLYSSGTYSELSVAAWLGKDIVCCLDNIKLIDMPLWIRGCLDGATFVNNIDAGISYYKSLIEK